MQSHEQELFNLALGMLQALVHSRPGLSWPCVQFALEHDRRITNRVIARLLGLREDRTAAMREVILGTPIRRRTPKHILDDLLPPPAAPAARETIPPIAAAVVRMQRPTAPQRYPATGASGIATGDPLAQAVARAKNRMHREFAREGLIARNGAGNGVGNGANGGGRHH